MIKLHKSNSRFGEVSVALRRRDGAVCYRKDGALQTLIDRRGRNLAPSIDDAVKILIEESAGRVLVLGHGGGVISTMLHRKGVDVVAVDIDPRAKRLAQLFFRSPPSLPVVTSDAATYVTNAPGASFCAVVVDFQDGEATPASYLSEDFWRGAARLLRPKGLVLIKISNWLRLGEDWSQFQSALVGAGLDAFALGDEQTCGHRLLVTYGA